ncbi:g8084 [Coccomyxa elongata]
MEAKRQLPNVLVTGTPGTGKSTTCEQIAEATRLRHVNVGDLVRSQDLHCGWDEEYSCHIIDEDKICDALEDQMNRGGNIVDYHGCDFFPERWFDLVIVLQTDNTVLYERLEKRGYPQKKLSENVECEIMHVIVQEALESYREEIVQVLPSNTVEDLESNVERTVQWYKQVTCHVR